MDFNKQIYALLNEMIRSVELPKFKDAIGLLKKVANNIVSNPTVDQYRSIKKANKTLQNRLFIHPNIDAILRLTGFIEDAGIYVNASSNIQNLQNLIVIIEGFEVDVEVMENNMGADPAEVKRRADAVEQEEARKKAEMDKLSNLIKSDRQEVVKEFANKPIKDSKENKLTFGANTKTCKDVGIGQADPRSR